VSSNSTASACAIVARYSNLPFQPSPLDATERSATQVFKTLENSQNSAYHCNLLYLRKHSEHTGITTALGSLTNSGDRALRERERERERDREREREREPYLVAPTPYYSEEPCVCESGTASSLVHVCARVQVGASVMRVLLTVEKLRFSAQFWERV